MSTKHRRTSTARIRWSVGIAAAVALTTGAVTLTANAHPAPPATVDPSATAEGSNVVIEWNKAMAGALSTAQAGKMHPTSPPVGARAFAVIHMAMYDAWAAYDSKAVGTQYGADLRRPPAERTAANKQAAISYAAHRVLTDFFPEQRATFDRKLTDLGYSTAYADDPQAGSAQDIALKAADAVIEDRADDGSNQKADPAYKVPAGYYTPVNPPQEIAKFDKDALKYPDRWAPLKTPDGMVHNFLTPQFATGKPYAVKDIKTYLSPKPPKYGSLAASRAIAEQMKVNAGLTERQKAIAEHWQYPGSTSSSIPQEWAAFVSQRDGHTLDEDVKMFFALNLAEGDESVVDWMTKVTHDYARPITMIRYAMAGKDIRGWAGPGKGTRTIKGETWTPYLKTPAFAAYGSGHTGFTAVAAETLKLYTGSDRYGNTGVIKAGSSKIEPGMPSKDVRLKWNTFSEAAKEVGDSRIYGGAHWQFDHDSADEQGRDLAKDVWKVSLSYFDGTHTKEQQ
ncbi:vanadium-dependent haloperoxidase [Streptomyces sp. NPDC015130]|uniref:vanadium-dependent haloperoxidase n=1 Tax=Streptomyces sp. NPDC015130 TaxID=3364940 RepID=UPI0036F6595A